MQGRAVECAHARRRHPPDSALRCHCLAAPPDPCRPDRRVTVGGGKPVVVQSMTNTDTADVASSVKQVAELWRAGSEMVRLTVNTWKPLRRFRASSTSWR
jgi:hypothetical protein